MNAEQHLLSVFRRARDKHEAHRLSAPILQDLTGDRGFLTAVLRRHLETPGALAATNYPVVAFDVALNEHFGVVVNSWIPLPDRDTDMSTKAIHHHGEMLLTTATMFGPGYEHWLFSRPRRVDEGRHLYEIDVVERAPHPAHHVAFVDADTPHLPWYPPDTTLTLCLWSSRRPVSWRDRVKRIPLLKNNEQQLRQWVERLGLTRLTARAMQIKLVELFDFYPTPEGFVGMVDREEYARGSNDDHLHSLFHVLQRSGNEALGSSIDASLAHEGGALNRPLITKLLGDLRAGREIEGRLSGCHIGVRHANFTKNAVEVAARRGVKNA